MPPTFPVGPGSNALRKGRCSIAGQVYLVTFTTLARQRWFADFDLACAAARAVNDHRLWRSSRLLAWVLMPDHWHGLVELGEAESLSALIQKLKSNSSRRTRATGLAWPHVWASGFHDRALRRDDDLEATARYLVLNPVRAGLVCRLGDYAFWDAVWVVSSGWLVESIAADVAPARSNGNGNGIATDVAPTSKSNSIATDVAPTSDSNDNGIATEVAPTPSIA